MATQLEILTALSDGPLSTPELIRKLGDPRPAQRALAGAGYQLRRLQEKGLVHMSRVIPGAWQKPPTHVWEITEKGQGWAKAKAALDFIEMRGGSSHGALEH